MDANTIIRIDMNILEFEYLQEVIKNLDSTDINQNYIKEKLTKLIKSPSVFQRSEAKQDAMEQATRARSKKAKEKIEKAHKQLKLDIKRGTAKKMSYYAISKLSGVHINTVKKYITLDEVKVIIYITI